MSNTTEQLLRQATVSTFEELAFLFLEDECAIPDGDAPLDAVAAVDFHGPMRGRLVIRASSNLLPVIASNMMGEDAAQHRPMQRDALGEIANVVCGNLLPMLAGSEAVFRLDAPQWRADMTDARDGDAPIARVRFAVEDGRAQAELFVFTGLAWLAATRPEHATA